MTVGVGQTVTRVETTTVVVEIWQLWYFLQLGVLDEVAEEDAEDDCESVVVLVGWPDLVDLVVEADDEADDVVESEVDFEVEVELERVVVEL